MDLMSLLSVLSEKLFRPLYEGIRGDSQQNRRVNSWRERLHIPMEQAQALEKQMLTNVLSTAYSSTVYYKQLFDDLGIGDRLDDISAFESIPLLTKREIRSHGKDLLNNVLDTDKLRRTMTGGSSGDPLVFYRDEDAFFSRRALQIAANISLSWYPGERFALVWGANQDLPENYSWRYRLMNQLIYRQVVLNASALDDNLIDWYLGELERIRPRIMYGYPVVISLLARVAIKRKIKFPYIDKVIVTAEPLLLSDKSLIEEAFSVSVFNRYASREFGVVADQCFDGDFLRIHPCSVKIEILPFTPEDPHYGEIVITDLLNIGMPFIRYRTGDFARLTVGSVEGVEGMYLSELEGRTCDLIVTSSGRLISGTSLTPSFFEKHPEILQAQIHQIELKKFSVKVVLDSSLPYVGLRAGLEHSLSNYCGELVDVQLAIVETIPRDVSGKFHFVISDIKPTV